jgi:hypothetical protein
MKHAAAAEVASLASWTVAPRPTKSGAGITPRAAAAAAAMLGVNDLYVKKTERAAPPMDARYTATRPHVAPPGTRCFGAPMTAINTIDGNYYPGMLVNIRSLNVHRLPAI